MLVLSNWVLVILGYSLCNNSSGSIMICNLFCVHVYFNIKVKR